VTESSKIADALCKAQSLMKSAKFNRQNPHFKNKYADLTSILEAIRKPLCDNGLSVTQTTQINDHGLVLLTTLRHSSGETIVSEYPLPLGGKPQEIGSALTYARRYCLSAIVCLSADEDDDAEVAQKAETGDVISEQQAETIRQLLIDTKANAPVFLQYIGAPSISDIPASKYNQALAALEKKRKAAVAA
jgi:hypothetical protein